MRTPGFLLLLCVLGPQAACVCPPWVCGIDDGERPDDDDDAVGDDDDRVQDEDLDSIVFSMELRASPGDDDDSAEEPVTAVLGTLRVRYQTEDGGLLCEQHVAFDAEARFDGAPDCAGCTGFLQIRASSAEDVSNPFLDSDHCDPASAQESGLDFGMQLLRPAGVGGLGDLLSIALVDAETGLERDLRFAPDAALSYAGQAEDLAEDGLVLTHGGYLRSTPGGMVEGAGIDEVAGSPAEGDPWFGFWRIFVDPQANGFEGPELSGRYSAQSVWRVFPR